ncbi:hypothetical protein AAG906_025115 [Vitis piasezkii]
MARIRGGYTNSSLSRSSTSQAPEAPTIPSFEGGVPSNLPHRLDIHSLILGPLPILNVLPAYHRNPSSKGLWSLCRPLRAIQIVELDHFISSYISTLRVAMDFYQSMTTQGAQNPTAIHFSIDGHQGILKARHIAEALHIPYEPMNPTHFREWSPVSQRDMVHILSRRTSGDSVLLRKELPPRMLLLLCHILEHMGYPTEPHLERRHHCQEQFTLEKWTQLAGYSAPLGALPRPAPPMPPQSIPQAPTPPMPEVTSNFPPTTPAIPSVAPFTFEASITISTTEFRAMVHLFQTLTTTHNALFR